VPANTRKPRLLVKMRTGAAAAAVKFGASKIDVNIEPLFKSIKPPTKTGMAAAPEWHLVSTPSAAAELNQWELCHQLLTAGMGIAGGGAEFAEPDTEQQWDFGKEAQLALSIASPCGDPWNPNPRLPPSEGTDSYWFRDDDHSQLQRAREEVGEPQQRVRIAHFDTGYSPEHITKPKFLRTDLQRNFVDSDRPDDASDQSSGIANNLGHGTGTLSILAGNIVNGTPLGGAAFLDVVPIRVANSVVLFKNSSIAQALDYVHSLANDPNKRVHVITMSMGGLASHAWADAVNALYELGVFIVTAAGNNFGSFPTHNIVYPARFKRVVAACGVMADGRPYADLPFKTMAGNYGPGSKMSTALSGFTPNVPWARLACSQIVDHSGQGTSAATPQIASAAALWIQKYKSEWENYSEGWMRVEAVKKALFDSAHREANTPDRRLGRGSIRALAALAERPAREADLKKEKEDSASFPFLRVITGFGVAAASNARQRMLELEALQLSQQSHDLEELLPDSEDELKALTPAKHQQIIDALASVPGASRDLKEALGKHVAALAPQVVVPAELSKTEAAAIQRAMSPPVPTPVKRSLQVFAFDPLAGLKLETVDLNNTTIDVRWEDLKPGPVGDYLEVVDVDPATGVCYAPVDLNHPLPLSQAGLSPSESDPQFHQQMVYAVAMKTISHFEHALGRVALWAPRIVKEKGEVKSYYVPRLRIYPHALREANSFYSPEKAAVLFGYFPASESNPGQNLPGQTVFCCLSHDIVAHETTHALLDGLHRRFREPTNVDVLAFHEAFSDIVALFQHFTVPEALRHQIAKTRGDLSQQNLLGELAQQFGQGIGQYGALRSAIGDFDKSGKWAPAQPSNEDYQSVTEAHLRGAILVAAVFDAFLKIYQKRTVDLVRLATGGTGVLPEGEIPHILIERLAREASKTASHVLNMCIRALDYCPPMDITFGEYIRALITADYDLVPDDDLGYRVAFTEAFRRRGIYPQLVRSLSTESVRWASPELDLNIDEVLEKMSLTWDLHANRRGAYQSSTQNAAIFHDWLKNKVTDDQALSLGFYRSRKEMTVGNETGTLSSFEVHSVRPVRRVGPDGQQQLDLVVEITQTWRPARRLGDKYRGGSTLIIGLEDRRVRYTIRKRVAHADRIGTQQSFRLSMMGSSIRSNYFDDTVSTNEPFAMLHRSV
jgi:Subtilase family